MIYYFLGLFGIFTLHELANTEKKSPVENHYKSEIKQYVVLSLSTVSEYTSVLLLSFFIYLIYILGLKCSKLKSFYILFNGKLFFSGGWGVSAEYLNFAVALVIYAVRYPAVFWTTNKGFGTLFSCQLLANAAQQLVSFASFCVLYKVISYF